MQLTKKRQSKQTKKKQQKAWPLVFSHTALVPFQIELSLLLRSSLSYSKAGCEHAALEATCTQAAPARARKLGAVSVTCLSCRLPAFPAGYLPFLRWLPAFPVGYLPFLSKQTKTNALPFLGLPPPTSSFPFFKPFVSLTPCQWLCLPLFFVVLYIREALQLWLPHSFSPALIAPFLPSRPVQAGGYNFRSYSHARPAEMGIFRRTPRTKARSDGWGTCGITALLPRNWTGGSDIWPVKGELSLLTGVWFVDR